MLIQKMTKDSYPFELSTIDSKTITNIWANDGWCYVPELQVRRKFQMTYEDNVFEITEERWGGVTPLSEYSEAVLWSLYSESPRIWSEEAPGFCEIYVEKSQTQGRSKKTSGRRPALQSQK